MNNFTGTIMCCISQIAKKDLAEEQIRDKKSKLSI
jgi:hypothetical protein